MIITDVIRGIMVLDLAEQIMKKIDLSSHKKDNKDNDNNCKQESQTHLIPMVANKDPSLEDYLIPLLLE